MRLRRVVCIIGMMTALAAPAPGPSPEALARAEIESAIVLEQAGRYGEAIEQLSHAITAQVLSDADTARALFDRGLAYDGLGNMRAAVADYSAALKRDPGLAPALNNRANAYRREGRLTEAKRDYWASLKCSPAREYPYYGLGLIAQQEGDTEAARGYFQHAVAVNPNFRLAAQSLTAMMGPPIETPKTAAGLRRSQDEDRVLPAAVQMPSAAPVGEGVPVQLGAFLSEAVAREAWVKIAAGSGDALQGLTPRITPVDRPGKERLWRLRTAAADREGAVALCTNLTRRQLACVLVRH